MLVTAITSNPFESYAGHIGIAGPTNSDDVIVGGGQVRTAGTPVMIESVTINNDPQLDKFESWWGKHDEANLLTGIGIVGPDDNEVLDRSVWSTRIESDTPVLEPHSEYSLMLVINAGGRPQTRLDSVGSYSFTLHPYICLFEDGTDPECWDFDQP